MHLHVPLTFSKIAFVYQTRDHMTVFKVVVVIRAKYIRWYHTCKLASILLIICPVIIREWRKKHIIMPNYVVVKTFYMYMYLVISLMCIIHVHVHVLEAHFDTYKFIT